jgi:hypothetical protein
VPCPCDALGALPQKLRFCWLEWGRFEQQLRTSPRSVWEILKRICMFCVGRAALCCGDALDRWTNDPTKEHAALDTRGASASLASPSPPLSQAGTTRRDKVIKCETGLSAPSLTL